MENEYTDIVLITIPTPYYLSSYPEWGQNVQEYHIFLTLVGRQWLTAILFRFGVFNLPNMQYGFSRRRTVTLSHIFLQCWTLYILPRKKYPSKTFH